ncbi:MAG: DSD1 family PLP-dependent enzyme [Acidobacteria bacterium]|nr:DSD1 family PLP-dependent enzyme [Acidobacteriota bacterium]MCI0720469.1 DSD1 family PLP-dependent enzyme [Acidobacteriota bacterium]
MKVTRRSWIGMTLSLATTPTLLSAKPRSGYSLVEIEKRLHSGKGIEGMMKDELPTPALLVDLDLLESNIQKMSQHSKASSIQLRPHAKTHKCPEIARRQVQAGGLGVCTSTIHEAEVMAAAGIRDLLITSELVGKNKTERLLRLTSKQPGTMSVVDHATHAEQLNEAAAAAKLTLNVLIDIDPIGRRTGILPGDDALGLAEKIMKLPHLKLRGVHAYSGASSHVPGFEARQEHSHRVMQAPLESFFRMQKAGMPVEIMSGGSTGTYNIDPALKGMTELQTGSYVFMDVDYRRVGGKSGAVYEDFAPSLSVLATVISKNHPDRATVDAGFKAFATDRKFGPEIKGVTGVDYQFNGDEHGALIFSNVSREIRLGDRLEFIVPHCDPNVNLYDRFFCVRGDKVMAVWPVAGRGYS